MNINDFSYALLAATFTYSPSTGIIRWTGTSRLAGAIDPVSGGVGIMFNGKRLSGLRVAYILHTKGPIPDGKFIRPVAKTSTHADQRFINLFVTSEANVVTDGINRELPVKLLPKENMILDAIRDYAGKLTAKTIAKKVGVSYSYLKQVAHFNNLSLKIIQ